MNLTDSFRKKKVRCMTAAVVCAAMLVPALVRGIPLDSLYSDERVVKTWNLTGDQLAGHEETGLAYNWTSIPRSVKAGDLFPFDHSSHFTARTGYEKDKFKDFNGRFLYCAANHTQGYRLEPGQQIFFMKDYGIGHENGLFGPTKHTGNSDNENNFNFLMTAIACGYPNSYDAENMSDIAYYLICQTIVWGATNDGARGFKGAGKEADNAAVNTAFEQDLAYFRSLPEYRSLEATFPQSVAPEIYARLHAAPPAGSAAANHRMPNLVDAVFDDIWTAAYLTNCLEPDWDKELSATVTTAREEGGVYYVDIDLFVNDMAQIYLKGIDFEGYGDWKKMGQDEDGTMHFSSPTGETDENGRIGGDDDDGEYESGCVRHEHEETFTANYNISLLKYDSETGKPLAGSHWDVLEKFDDSQLDNTDLDRTPDAPGSYEGSLGSLNDTEWGDDEISSNYSGGMGVTQSDTNKFNWGNDNGSQFERWDDPADGPCTRDDNVTKEDGLLYEIDSSGAASGDRAHTDIKKYTYHKGYCDGHPAPEIHPCSHNFLNKQRCQMVKAEKDKQREIPLATHTKIPYNYPE